MAKYNQDIIVEYIEGKLSKKEKEKIENQIINDTKFASQVAFARAIVKEIENFTPSFEDLEIPIQKVEELDILLKKYSKNALKRNKIYYFLGFLMVIIILIGIGIYTKTSPPG